MPNGVATTRASLLLIHDDSDLLDALTRVFEARGCEVAIAATAFAVLSRLDSGREYHAVIAGWDATQGLGRFAYEWVLDNRYDLRGRFVFLARESPGSDFDAVVRGRCLLLSSYDLDEIVRVTEATIKESHQREAEQRVEVAGGNRPLLLLVEDEPLQLRMMTLLLAEMGFAVTAVESGEAAIALLERGDEFDVILSDWYMPNGSGGDLYEWLARHRPDLAARSVFMSAALPPTTELVRRAPGRPWVHKGQDSPVLMGHLWNIARVPRRQHASGAA